MTAADIGGLLIAAALLAQTDLFGDLLAKDVPGPYDPPGLLSFEEWQVKNPGGSQLDYGDYVLGA